MSILSRCHAFPCGWPTTSLLTVLVAVIAGVMVSPDVALGGEPQDIRELKLRDWQPRSMLVTPATEIAKPKYAAIDAHNHLGGECRGWSRFQAAGEALFL